MAVQWERPKVEMWEKARVSLKVACLDAESEHRWEAVKGKA